MKEKRNWTLDELKFLVENYKEKSDNEIAKILKRSFDSVAHTRTKYGLRKRKRGVRGRPAKIRQQHIEYKARFLKALHNPNVSIHEISEEFGKPVMFVVYKAYLLRKSSDWRVIKKKISVARKRLYQEHDKFIKKEYYKKNREKIIEYNDKIYPQRLKQERIERYKRVGLIDPQTGEFRYKMKKGNSPTSKTNETKI